MEFSPFPSLTRFSQDWTITEKIDGSNAQVLISPLYDPQFYLGDYAGLNIYAGSRSRYLTADKHGDHMGFASWVTNNARTLIEMLGEGRHFGEWWGQGIQRGYDLNERRFSLFNAARWKGLNGQQIPGLYAVPVINGVLNSYVDDVGTAFAEAMRSLEEHGSYATEEPYFNPEGIVMYHGRSGTSFKKTFDYDEYGKWAEKNKA